MEADLILSLFLISKQFFIPVSSGLSTLNALIVWMYVHFLFGIGNCFWGLIIYFVKDKSVYNTYIHLRKRFVTSSYSKGKILPIQRMILGKPNQNNFGDLRSSRQLLVACCKGRTESFNNNIPCIYEIFFIFNLRHTKFCF